MVRPLQSGTAPADGRAQEASQWPRPMQDGSSMLVGEMGKIVSQATLRHKIFLRKIIFERRLNETLVFSRAIAPVSPTSRKSGTARSRGERQSTRDCVAVPTVGAIRTGRPGSPFPATGTGTGTPKTASSFRGAIARCASAPMAATPGSLPLALLSGSNALPVGRTSTGRTLYKCPYRSNRRRTSSLAILGFSPLKCLELLQ